MSAITAKASRKMKKYAVLTREPRCFLGSFDFSWEQRKLGEIGSVSMCRRIFKEQTSETGDIPFYKIGTFGADPDAFISRELFEEYKSKYPYPQKGDILISASGSIGRTVEFAGNNEYFQDSNIVWLNHDERLSNPFLKCFYSVVKWAGIEGSTIKRLYNDNILNTVICMPSVPEQKRIGLFFENLDNLITLHQRKCANLCSPSQVVFSLLFATSTFSWEQRKFGEITSKYEDPVPTPHDGYYRLGIRSHAKGTFHSYVAKGQELETAQMHRVAAGNFIVNITFGWEHAVAITDKNDAGKLVSHRFPQFSFAEGMVPEFFRYVIVDEKFRHHLWLASPGGAGRNRVLKLDEMLNYLMRFPSRDEQIKIAEFFRHLDNLITLHQRECISFTGRADRLILTANKKRTTSSWEQRKLSEITDKVTEKNAGLQYVETFTNSAEFGIISQRDFFDHDIAKLGSLDGYYIVKNEDFVYNPRISTSAPVGPINRNKLGRTGVMSPLYTVFRPHDIDTTYLEYFFKCGYWHSFMNFNGDSGARSDRFSIRDNVFFQMPIPIPDIDEQREIGELLTCLDNLITLHQRKPFLMKWRTSDANRNQTNRLVL